MMNKEIGLICILKYGDREGELPYDKMPKCPPALEEEIAKTPKSNIVYFTDSHNNNVLRILKDNCTIDCLMSREPDISETLEILDNLERITFDNCKYDEFYPTL